MITRSDLEEAIAECQGLRNPNANTCIKLAAYYTILNEMDKGAEPPPTYSMAASPPDDRIYMDSDTEFATVVEGVDRRTFFEVMDELMETIRILNPPLYAGVLRKFK